MKIADSINTILKAAIAIGCIYAVWTWQFNDSKNGDNSAYARSACIDEINNRLDATSVNVFAVEETANGYVVRASATMPKGSRAKIYCVTSAYGRVEDVRILEQ